MSIRLDPRRLAALKLLAAEGGQRPGELVTKWVEERLDAARAGIPSPLPQSAGAQPSPAALAELSARVDELSRRVDRLSHAQPTAAAATVPTAGRADDAQPASAAQPAKRRGRPPKAKSAVNASRSAGPRIALHDEITAVIAERGPLTAGELAAAIVERGRYSAPRSAKPLDAATVSARVSNPIYRPRFVRNKGRISLATAT
ncbi:MAG: hypothetical protein ABJC24_08165 [Chloroflexota bacterium]